ncbi:GNAT family N-acetyltransferase [Nocardia blacklockiae]|uniref:GNAT family N-acetyltransferase n=1 Tax=Nocardia blacklockiae TaxID=480036 RepID=UPI0018951FD8|nr:GNAT family N-acetyltransferase [Nocardia blacklockiae]MBF6176032.1 GNAT family N-acetyltransferase [Nocardia blacklockiae]
MNDISADHHLPVEVRAARGRTEFRRFHHFAHLSGNPSLAVGVREMWMAEKAKLLASALPPRQARDSLDRAWEILDVQGMVLARSLALVALTHGEVVAGLTAGPAPRFVRRFAPAGSHAIRRAITATMQIHLLAVEPDYRRGGVARTLLTHLLNLAGNAGTMLVYARADTETAPAGPLFACGFTAHTLAEPVEFSTHGITATEPTRPGTTLYSRNLSPSRPWHRQPGVED